MSYKLQTNLDQGDRIRQTHVDVPHKSIIGKFLDRLQLFATLFLEKGCVHFLPSMPLPLPVLVIYTADHFPNFFQIVQVMSAPKIW